MPLLVLLPLGGMFVFPYYFGEVLAFTIFSLVLFFAWLPLR